MGIPNVREGDAERRLNIKPIEKTHANLRREVLNRDVVNAG